MELLKYKIREFSVQFPKHTPQDPTKKYCLMEDLTIIKWTNNILKNLQEVIFTCCT